MQTAMKGDVWCKKNAIRLAVNINEWNPTELEWNKAMKCIQIEEERERIRKFRYQKDAKASLVGRLLMHFWAQQTFPSHEKITFSRSPRGRPLLMNNYNWDFNVSHAGSFAVFAAQSKHQFFESETRIHRYLLTLGNSEGVGVDVMGLKDSRCEASDAKQAEFFRLMNRQFTKQEWQQIGKSLPTFFRFWTLKEAFVKALGTGLNFDLQRLSFLAKSTMDMAKE